MCGPEGADIQFTRVGLSGGCGCYQSRIVHEATHLIAQPGDVSEDKPTRYQNCIYPNGNISTTNPLTEPTTK